jgi:alcohol dehydrogenase (cytochrome c)
LKAIRGATGEEVWEFVFPEQSPGSPIGGVLTTAGDLAFSGHDETFYAVDVRTGEELWRFRAGGKINAPPVSYSVDGRQFIAVALGHGVFAFALP